MSHPDERYYKRLAGRHRLERAFVAVCFGSTMFGLLVLFVLLAVVVWNAAGWVDWQFLTSFDSRLEPDNAGILAAMVGSVWLIAITAAVSVPVGVGAAIYLEEFATDSRLTRLIQLNLANLAGVPSIVYGLLGLTVFARFLAFGTSIVSGALTLSLLILPVVIVAAQEALRAVPNSIRQASLALGATEWQTVQHQVLPASLPGILTGVILAISRAVGETAPLVIIGAMTFMREIPNPTKDFTALPIQIYNWIGQSKDVYLHKAAAGILVLLTVLLLLNTAAIIIRQRFQKSLNW